jgi:hypothetical protein
MSDFVISDVELSGSAARDLAVIIAYRSYCFGKA